MSDKLPELNITPENDFGFAICDEAELRKHELELKQKMEEHVALTNRTVSGLNNNVAGLNIKVTTLHSKVETLRDMVLPLLNNLTADESKSYIFWPNRSEKIKEFIKKINDFVETPID